MVIVADTDVEVNVGVVPHESGPDPVGTGPNGRSSVKATEAIGTVFGFHTVMYSVVLSPKLIDAGSYAFVTTGAPRTSINASKDVAVGNDTAVPHVTGVVQSACTLKGGFL